MHIRFKTALDFMKIQKSFIICDIDCVVMNDLSNLKRGVLPLTQEVIKEEFDIFDRPAPDKINFPCVVVVNEGDVESLTCESDDRFLDPLIKFTECYSAECDWSKTNQVVCTRINEINDNTIIYHYDDINYRGFFNNVLTYNWDPIVQAELRNFYNLMNHLFELKHDIHS